MLRHDSNKIIHFPGAEGDRTALRIRVDLLLMPAPVWRLLELPGACTFWDLHVAIQDAFGWRDRHLHQFVLDLPGSGQRLRLGIPDDSGFQIEDEVLPGWEHRVSRYLRAGLAPALYTYDFGDDWLHEINLEGILQSAEPALLPRCTEGAGQAPREDCGGPPAVDAQQVVSRVFEPCEICFDNPRERWQRAFGHD